MQQKIMAETGVSLLLDSESEGFLSRYLRGSRVLLVRRCECTPRNQSRPIHSSFYADAVTTRNMAEPTRAGHNQVYDFSSGIRLNPKYS
jgi:hypothetical protein